jgi:hypothetical protein
MVPVQQQQRQQGQVGSSSQHALQQERPVVLSLTPPNQLTAALQRPDSSGRQQRRTHASSSAASAASSADAPHKQQQQAADASAALPQQSQQLQQEALFSPAGRPLRQQSSRRNAATAAAERYQRLDRDTGPVSYAGGLRFLQVWCDQLPGNLDLQRMLVIPQAGEVSRGDCIDRAGVQRRRGGLRLPLVELGALCCAGSNAFPPLTAPCTLLCVSACLHPSSERSARATQCRCLSLRFWAAAAARASGGAL